MGHGCSTARLSPEDSPPRPRADARRAHPTAPGLLDDSGASTAGAAASTTVQAPRRFNLGVVLPHLNLHLKCDSIGALYSHLKSYENLLKGGYRGEHLLTKVLTELPEKRCLDLDAKGAPLYEKDPNAWGRAKGPCRGMQAAIEGEVVFPEPERVTRTGDSTPYFKALAFVNPDPAFGPAITPDELKQYVDLLELLFSIELSQHQKFPEAGIALFKRVFPTQDEAFIIDDYLLTRPLVACHLWERISVTLDREAPGEKAAFFAQLLNTVALRFIDHMNEYKEELKHPSKTPPLTDTQRSNEILGLYWQMHTCTQALLSAQAGTGESVAPLLRDTIRQLFETALNGQSGLQWSLQPLLWLLDSPLHAEIQEVLNDIAQSTPAHAFQLALLNALHVEGNVTPTDWGQAEPSAKFFRALQRVVQAFIDSHGDGLLDESIEVYLARHNTLPDVMLCRHKSGSTVEHIVDVANYFSHLKTSGASLSRFLRAMMAFQVMPYDTVSLDEHPTTVMSLVDWPTDMRQLCEPGALAIFPGPTSAGEARTPTRAATGAGEATSLTETDFQNTVRGALSLRGLMSPLIEKISATDGLIPEEALSGIKGAILDKAFTEPQLFFWVACYPSLYAQLSRYMPLPAEEKVSEHHWVVAQQLPVSTVALEPFELRNAYVISQWLAFAEQLSLATEKGFHKLMAREMDESVSLSWLLHTIQTKRSDDCNTNFLNVLLGLKEFTVGESKVSKTAFRVALERGNAYLLRHSHLFVPEASNIEQEIDCNLSSLSRLIELTLPLLPLSKRDIDSLKLVEALMSVVDTLPVALQGPLDAQAQAILAVNGLTREEVRTYLQEPDPVAPPRTLPKTNRVPDVVKMHAILSGVLSRNKKERKATGRKKILTELGKKITGHYAEPTKKKELKAARADSTNSEASLAPNPTGLAESRSPSPEAPGRLRSSPEHRLRVEQARGFREGYLAAHQGALVFQRPSAAAAAPPREATPQGHMVAPGATQVVTLEAHAAWVSASRTSRR